MNLLTAQLKASLKLERMVKQPVCKHCGRTKRCHMKAPRHKLWWCWQGGTMFELTPKIVQK